MSKSKADVAVPVLAIKVAQALHQQQMHTETIRLAVEKQKSYNEGYDAGFIVGQNSIRRRWDDLMTVVEPQKVEVLE